MVALLRRLRQDLDAFRQCWRAVSPPCPGLYTYRFSSAGGQRRLHLRIEQDLRGVLFVDAADAVHLNPTATELAKWALDGVSRPAAQSRILTRVGSGRRRQVAADVSAVYGLVERVASPAAGCPTCALEGVPATELFSTPVSAPYKADLAITYSCNNDCPHCYNETDRLSCKTLPLQDWKRVVDVLCAVGVPHLILTGGEATLYDDLPELIAYADACGPLCGLNTNGRRLADSSYANTLHAAGLNHVQVTLGSHRAEIHDRMMNARCFGQTVRGIENALSAGLHTITNTTLMQMNVEECEATVEFLHGLGIRTFAVNGMIYSGGGCDTGQAISQEALLPVLAGIRDKANELGMRLLWYTPTEYCRLSPVQWELGAKRCNAGEYSLCVEPNGDVLPCQSYYQAAGNLLRDSWQDIWNAPLLVSFRQRQRQPQRHGLPEKCWECPDLSLCGGGCRIERQALTEGNTSEARVDNCGSGDGNHGLTPDGFVDLQSLLPAKKRRATGSYAATGTTSADTGLATRKVTN